MTTYLITGGAGFIGSHLAEALLAQGDSVHVLDDLSTGSIRNIESLKGVSRFRYTIDTLFNESVVAELVDSCDAVFHLAAAVGVKLIIESPVRTIETNVHGTEIVLKQAAKKGKPVLLASTSEVYGKSSKIPFSEEDDLVLGTPTRGRWSYAASKLLDEFLTLSYGKEKKLPVVIARLFNTVGPRQTDRYGMVIPTFIKQAIAGGPITVYGDGTQSRCFADVSDVTRALILLITSQNTNGQIFNVGNNEEITILGLAKKVRELVNKDVSIKKIPYEKAYEEGFEDMKRRVPSIAKIRKFVLWTPTLTINEILSRTIASIRKEIINEK